MATITQKEWLDFLNLLHTKLRNSKGIKLTGMPALLEISNFMLFRFMDNDSMGIELEDDLKFKQIYNKYATDKKIKEDASINDNINKNAYKLWKKMFDLSNKDKDKCLLVKYFENDHLNRYLNSATARASAFCDRPLSCETIRIL